MIEPEKSALRQYRVIEAIHSGVIRINGYWLEFPRQPQNVLEESIGEGWEIAGTIKTPGGEITVMVREERPTVRGVMPYRP